MNRSIILSSVLHVFVIILTAMSLPFLAKKPIDLPPIVSVELIQITEKTNIPFAPKAKKIIEEVKEKEKNAGPVPAWITLVHLGFIVWTIVMAHYPPVFLGSYLLFLGFHTCFIVMKIENYTVEFSESQKALNKTPCNRPTRLPSLCHDHKYLTLRNCVVLS